MSLTLWILNSLLAAAFLGAGALKLLRSPADLKEAGMGWVDDVSPGLVRFVGAAEVLGAVGLILPRALDVAPVLTPLAAVGLLLTMLGAILVHVRRQEPAAPPAVIAVLTLASAVIGFARL
ncbi:DoxX family protein [Nocardioides sp.]|uniref:DoxX family protein n=1 Tax=Nocardioides sp. TaxID=35761 RepID=UPI003518347D